MTAHQIINLIVSWLTQAVSIALLLLIACAVAAKYGLRLPLVPAIDVTALAWLTGAFFLWRGGRA